MSLPAEFLEECRLEWQRLGLPRDRIAVMLDELTAALGADEDVPDELEGIATADPRAFADGFATARGVMRPRLEYTTGAKANRRRVGTIILLALFAVGGVVGAIEFTSGASDSGDSSTDTEQTSFAPPDLVTVPNVVGSPVEIATSTAQRVGVRVGDVEKIDGGTKITPGTVLRETPPPGTKIRRGVTITLYVAR